MRSYDGAGLGEDAVRRAIATGDPLLALAAAAEMRSIELGDALALTLVLTRDAPARFDRAAARWHGRFCVERRDLGGDEAELVLAALRALPGRAGAIAAHALADFFELLGRHDLAEMLAAWLERRGS
jgi:hypothetical protein